MTPTKPTLTAMLAAASLFGAMGGRSKSARKSAASRRNGKLGGRPRNTDKAEARRTKPHGRSKHDPTREAKQEAAQ